MGLRDRAVLVAGGAGDIGQEIVKAFAHQGARVLIADLDLKRAQEVARRLNAFGVAVCHLDLTSEESVGEAVRFARESLGQIDVLVNVAGLLCRKPFFETSKADFESSFAVNVTGIFLISREVARGMKDAGGGTIINISSMNARLTVENRSLYGATKAALNMLTQSMALELGPCGISVNAVAPGIVDSKMARVRLNTPERVKAYADSIPLGRLTLPEDVAHCVLFLASPYAGHINGEILAVDGGLTVRLSLPRP